MTSDSQNTIVSTTVRSVLIPFNIPPRTASGALDEAALVLIDVATSSGITGRSYVFGYSQAILPALASTIDGLASMVSGHPVAPLSLENTLQTRLKLLDTPGLVGIALSGLDMAYWDAHSQFLGQPLSRVLGSDKKAIPAYNSCGLWMQDVTTLADEAEALLAEGGFRAIKLRLGRENPKEDLAAVRAVRKRIGDNVHLMVDFNQSQSVNSALMRTRMLDNEGLYWIEEPVRHADYLGSAAIAAAIKTPVQTGENLCSHYDLVTAINAKAANYYMPDVQKIIGVTGWMRASTLCHAHGIEISSHLFPEVSAHVLAASPTCHWLEYVDWANPVLQNPLLIENGQAMLPDVPGNGLLWDEKKVKHFAA